MSSTKTVPTTTPDFVLMSVPSMSNATTWEETLTLSGTHRSTDPPISSSHLKHSSSIAIAAAAPRRSATNNPNLTDFGPNVESCNLTGRPHSLVARLRVGLQGVVLKYAKVQMDPEGVAAGFSDNPDRHFSLFQTGSSLHCVGVLVEPKGEEAGGESYCLANISIKGLPKVLQYDTCPRLKT